MLSLPYRRSKGDSHKNTVDSEEWELLQRHKEHELRILQSETDGSNSLPFLKAIKPTWAVIPAGNAHGHPHAPARARLREAIDKDENILRTDDGPEGNDPTGDDSFIFVVNRSHIEKIIRVKMDD